MVVLVGATTVGCSTAPPCDARTVHDVVAPPPAPLPEGPSSPPTPGMVKVGGSWHWDRNHYEWIPSHWVTAPPGRRWAGPELGQDGGETTYVNGGFVCDGEK